MQLLASTISFNCSQGLPLPLVIRALLPRRQRSFTAKSTLLPQRSDEMDVLGESATVPPGSEGTSIEAGEDVDEVEVDGAAAPADASAAGKTPGSTMRLDASVAQDLLAASKIDPFRVVLRHECRQYNTLLDTVKSSLGRLLESIDGMTNLDPELEAVHEALSRNAVPKSWASVGFSSNKPLSSWFAEMLENIAFFAKWAGSVRAEPPAEFRLGAFCFPQALLSAVLQVRKHDL